MQTAEEQVVQHQLFGGAILLDFPARFTDISDFRPVPDNQEVLPCSETLLGPLETDVRILKALSVL
jgi:Ran-interacting Mog1 protein